VHFVYQRPAGEVLGVSMWRPVIDDLRDQEEYAIKLMEKMLFPILRHMVPARGDDQYGLAEDVDQAAFSHQTIAPDGILVTPPSHELKMIGAAGESLNPTPQLDYMLHLAYLGAGVSGTIMGTEDSSAAFARTLIRMPPPASAAKGASPKAPDITVSVPRVSGASPRSCRPV